MKAEGRPEFVPPRKLVQRSRGSLLLFLLALVTVCLLAGAQDFLHEGKRRQRIRVHLDRQLAVLGTYPDPEHRQRLREEILRQPLAGLTPLTEGMWTAGVLAGRWTRGTSRAAVIVENTSTTPRALALQLLAPLSSAEEPQSAFIDDGIATHRVLLASDGPRTVELPKLEPGGKRLLAVWTDRAWARDSGPDLGILLRVGDPVRLRLRELRTTRDLSRWREVAAELAADAYLHRFDLGDPRLTAFGVTPDGWTHGSEPAAVLAVNSSHRPFSPRLKIRGPTDPSLYPLELSIDDGRRIRQLTLEAPAMRVVRLRRVPANGKRLFALWSQDPLPTRTVARSHGIRIRARERAPAEDDTSAGGHRRPAS